MKKLFCFLMILYVFSEANIFAQTENESFEKQNNLSNSFFASVYLTDAFPIGKIAEYNKISFGHGIKAGYSFSKLPLSTNIIIESSINLPTAKNNIQSWNNLVVLCGVSYTLPVADFLDISPELDFGMTNNFISSEGTKNNTFTDLTIQISANLSFCSEKLKTAGFAFNINPFYRLMLEKSYIGQYAGLQAGIIFKF